MHVHAQTIMGVDVSSYEGTVNWSQVKGGGYMFAFAKATEGVTIKDSYFIGNETNGTAAGVYMGAYHFAHPENNTAVAEANYFLSVAKPYIKSCYLPPVLDLEDPPSGPALSTYFTSAQLTQWVQTWMNTVKDSTGISPIIYIGPSNASFVDSSLNVWGLWIDDYNSNPKNPPPNIGVWKNWNFKQYSWTGTIPGISGNNNVDQDVFHGDTNQFMQLVGCKYIVAGFTLSTKTTCAGSSITFTDKSASSATITGWQWTFAGGTPAASTNQNPVITYNTPGVYAVKEVVANSVGKDSLTYTNYIDVVGSATLPLIEDFQTSTFPPTGWYMNYPNSGDSAWELCTTHGYSSTQCMYFPANCGQTVNIAGERQQLYTPGYDFTSVKNAEMSFDVAYEPSNITSTPKYSDTLVVYYSTDCGSTWTSIYSKGGATLSTTGSTTGAGTDTAGSHGHGCFEPPSNSAWRKDSISLSSLYGSSSVMFSFESRSGWGNIIYLDNINVTAPGLTSVQNLMNSNDIKIYPNPNKGEFTIDINGQLSETSLTLTIYNILGETIYTSQLMQMNKQQIRIPNTPNGIYLYRINGSASLISEGKLIIEN